MAREKSATSSSKRGLRNLKAHAVSAKRAGSVKGGKPTAKASPKLFEAACKGTHIPEVVIE
jgi:type VI protein secretion system component Hcp